MNNLQKTIFAMSLIVVMVAVPMTFHKVAADPGGEADGVCYSWNSAYLSGWTKEPNYCQCMHSNIGNPDNMEVGLGVEGYYFGNSAAFYTGKWDFNSEAGWSYDGWNDPCQVYADAPLVCTFCYDYNPSNPTYYNYNCYSQDAWACGYYYFGQWFPLTVPGDPYSHYAHIRDYQVQQYFSHTSIEGVTQGEYHYWNSPDNHHYMWAYTQDPHWGDSQHGQENWSFAFLTGHYGSDWL
jgi:hypothetical protein